MTYFSQIQKLLREVTKVNAYESYWQLVGDLGFPFYHIHLHMRTIFLVLADCKH